MQEFCGYDMTDGARKACMDECIQHGAGVWALTPVGLAAGYLASLTSCGLCFACGTAFFVKCCRKLRCMDMKPLDTEGASTGVHKVGLARTMVGCLDFNFCWKCTHFS